MRLAGRLVIDASVVVEALSPVAYGERAVAIFDEAGSSELIELWSPDLVYPETISALRGLVLRGSVDPTQAESAIDRVLTLPLLVAGTAELVQEAWQLRHNVTVYDACYAVLARRLTATLVTADQPLARALHRLGEDVVHLSDVHHN